MPDPRPEPPAPATGGPEPDVDLPGPGPRITVYRRRIPPGHVLQDCGTGVWTEPANRPQTDDTFF